MAPPKIPVRIDRSKYSHLLTNPTYELQGDQGTFNPAMLGNLGFSTVSGSESAGDLVARKGSDYYLYHDNGNARGLVKIGNPATPVAAPIQAPVTSKPAVVDPMKVSGFNGVQFKKGGNIMGYSPGGGIYNEQNATDYSQYEDAVVDPNRNDAYTYKPKPKTGNTSSLDKWIGVGTGLATGTASAMATPTPSDPKKTGGFYTTDTTLGDQATSFVAGAAPALNAVVPGLGTAIGVGAPVLNEFRKKQLEQNQQVDDDGRFINKKNALISDKLYDASNPLSYFQKDTWSRHSIDKLEQKNVDLVTQRKADEEKDKMNLERDASLNQARYDRMFSGGKIVGKGTAKSDSIPAKVNGFVVPAENAPIAEEIREKVLQKPVKKAPLSQKGGTNVKLSNGEHLFTPEEVVEITAHGIDLDNLAPDSKTKLRYHLNCGGNLKMFGGGGNIGDDQINLSARKSYGVPSKTAPGKSRIVKRKIEPDNLIPVQTTSIPVSKSSDPALKPYSPSAAETAFVNSPGYKSVTTPDYTSNKTNSGSNFSDAISTGINFAIPAFQTAMGLKVLREAGKRPEDSLDKDYLRSIETARGNVATANTNARYGFSPQEQFLIDQRNQSALSAGRADARNYSGGSAASALNNERVAINDAYTNNLQSAIANKNLQLQKQDIAYGRQGALDNLISGKLNYSRLLFGDKMNAFQQNQQAGANLLGAGLDNAIGAGRYAQELSYMKDRDTKYSYNPFG